VNALRIIDDGALLDPGDVKVQKFCRIARFSHEKRAGRKKKVRV